MVVVLKLIAAVPAKRTANNDIGHIRASAHTYWDRSCQLHDNQTLGFPYQESVLHANELCELSTAMTSQRCVVTRSALCMPSKTPR